MPVYSADGAGTAPPLVSRSSDSSQPDKPTVTANSSAASAARVRRFTAHPFLASTRRTAWTMALAFRP